MPGRSFILRAAALAVAVPGSFHSSAADAQPAGACGQTAVLTEALETPLSPGFEPIRRVLQIRRNEPRYIELRLDGAQAVTLRTEARAGDPVMALLDEAGQVVAWDDDGGGAFDALIAADLGAGRYCVQIRPINAVPIDTAELVLVIESGLRLPPGQEPPCSDAVSTRDLALGLRAPVDPVAFDDVTDPASGRRDFRMSLAEPLALRIDLASGQFDTVLEIHGPSGGLIASNDDFIGTDSRIEQAFGPGDHCVTVRSFAGSGGAFSLALSEAEIEVPALPCGDQARTRPLASGYGRDAAPLHARGEIDGQFGESWFSLNIAERVDLRLDARSFDIDTVMELHDEAGALLAENDDGPEGRNSRIETALFPGDYCVTVRSYDEAVGPFDLTLVPAGMAPPPDAAAPDPATATGIEDMGMLGDEVRSYTIGGGATLWASFTLDAPASVTVSGLSVSSDFAVALFAADGTSLGEAGPVPAMRPAEVAADLPGGSFLVALTNHGAQGTILRQITVTRN
jgi:hypothetical protein